jgi:hypothetical protein
MDFQIPILDMLMCTLHLTLKFDVCNVSTISTLKSCQISSLIIQASLINIAMYFDLKSKIVGPQVCIKDAWDFKFDKHFTCCIFACMHHELLLFFLFS